MPLNKESKKNELPRDILKHELWNKNSLSTWMKDSLRHFLKVTDNDGNYKINAENEKLYNN